MELGIEKCAMLKMKCRKREITEGIELSNQKSVRTMEKKENYKYNGILEADNIREEEMKYKKKNKKKEHQENKKTSRNKTRK